MIDRSFSEERSAEVVADSFDSTPDPRLRTLLQSLVRHLHAFIKEVELTEAEWAAAINFLTATGQISDEVRQEFILLSDVLGVSMLVETINHRAGEATESTVLGPFHVVSSPERALGADIALDGKGEPCLVTGRVHDLVGQPVPAATIDVWQANDDGFYDVQQPGLQPERNLRGLFTADDDGAFWFRTIVPRYYPIPQDGPVGDLLRASGRHPLPGAHPFPRHGAGLPVGHHTSLRRRQCLHRLRCGLRGQAEPGAHVPDRRRPGHSGQVRGHQPVPHRGLHHRARSGRTHLTRSRARWTMSVNVRTSHESA